MKTITVGMLAGVLILLLPADSGDSSGDRPRELSIMQKFIIRHWMERVPLQITVDNSISGWTQTVYSKPVNLKDWANEIKRLRQQRESGQ